MAQATRVAVAVVESAGHILVGVRSERGSLPGKSEFPGGKCTTDETPRSCAVRECREETGLVVVPREHMLTTTHEYEHDTVELHFWKCALAPDLPDQTPPQPPFRWASLQELEQLDFPAANAEIVTMLTKALA